MEQLIHTLLKHYETGTMSRRELVGSLAALSLAGSSASAAQAFPAVSLNHASIQVSNLQRSVDYYQKTFGLQVQTENKAQQLVQLKLGSGHLSIHQQNGPASIDHFAIGLEPFNRDQVGAALKARGATAQDGGGAGLHVVDPDGILVQVIAATA
ncbi:MAG TPA: VOC family protein [Micropepsaceae bacterium]|nr:VOC family protein [Micropepsaceae bacterium]